jgi:opacity protein-like surface antigen
MRKLSFNDATTTAARGYDVTGAPGFFVAGELYPLAGGKGVLRDIGVTASYAQTIGLKSAPEGGDKVDTTWNRWYLGLRVRIRTGGEKSPIVYLGAGYGGEKFDIAAEGALAAVAPNVAYTFLRFGLDARLPIGPAAILGGAALRLVQGAGDIADRFNDAKASSFDVHLGLAYTVTEGIEARLIGRLARYSYTFSDAKASGAGDTMASLMVGVAYVF